MSRDIRYTGMDVHKEAVVMAVRNSTGPLVVESIVETKASSLLQFIHGLQGELQAAPFTSRLRSCGRDTNPLRFVHIPFFERTEYLYVF